MNSIPLFDSLTHPTINGNWLQPEHNGLNSIEKLQEDMHKSNVQWAFAVGMGSRIGAYKEDTYVSLIKDCTSEIFPIAYFDFDFLRHWKSCEDYIMHIKELGYSGIKIHPRFSTITYRDPRLPEIIELSNNAGLVVMMCTYGWDNSIQSIENSLDNLVRLLVNIPDQKLILLHGGGIQLLQVVEISRHFPNVLVDLSFTMCKYEKSSIDLDIRYLFNSFDRRICIGSDSPEFRLSELRRRFNYFSDGIHATKLENIAHRNLLKFVGLSV